jgi:putative MATE family efflux protein
MKNDLTKGAISSQVKSIAIPSSLGFFFYSMFNITDTYFAGTISSNAIASLVLASTVYFMIISISRGMGTAVTSLVGNAIGSKDHIKVQNIVIHTYIFAFFMITFLYMVYFIAIEYIFSFTNASGEYLSNSIIFIDIIVMGLPFYLLSSYSNAILVSNGDTKSFRNVLIFNFFLNILLNIWFIYGGFGMAPLGFSGIAYATITTEFISMLFLFYRVKRLNLIENFDDFSFDFTHIKEILSQGMPSTLNMTLMSLGSFILIYFLSTLGEDVVAAYGIGIRLEQMALIPSIGVGVAVIAMISQNNGAKNYKRIKEIMSKIYKYAFILYGLGFVFMLICSYILTPYFTQTPTIINEVDLYVKINAVLLLAYIIIFINVSFLQAIKQPKMIFYIGLARQIILPFIFYSIALYYDLDVLYYWLGTFASVALATFYIHLLQEKYLKELLR